MPVRVIPEETQYELTADVNDIFSHICNWSIHKIFPYPAIHWITTVLTTLFTTVCTTAFTTAFTTVFSTVFSTVFTTAFTTAFTTVFTTVAFAKKAETDLVVFSGWA